MPRLFPRHGLFQGHSRHGRQSSRGRHTSFPLLHQENDWSRLWDAVIQYSSRHLYCPAHHGRGIRGSTKNSLLEVNSVARMSILSVPSCPLPQKTSFLRSTAIPTSRPLAPLIQYARRPLSTSRRAMVSNCVALHEEQVGDTDRSAPSSEAGSRARASTDQDQLRNNQHNNSIPDLPSHQQQQQLQKKQQQKQIQQLLLWRFPEPTHRRPMPIEAWPSTNKTLADFYRSLNKVLATSPPPLSHNTYAAGHHRRQSSSSNTSFSKHEATLHHVMHLYKSLSDLQHRHGTILVSPRHVRSLFLAVSRQEKSSTHLDHILMLASDLIWLRNRQQQHTTGDNGTSSKQPWSRRLGRKPPMDNAHLDTSLFHHQQQEQSQSPSPGLLVSEYTILMDWIGAFPADHETLCRQPWAHPAVSDRKGQRDAHAASSTPTCSTRDQDARKDSLVAVAPVSGTASRPALHYNTSKTSTLTKHRVKKSEDSLHSTKSIGPNTSLAVDRVWAIWQAFQQTQMKPDIVLFTTLMNILAKAKQFDKADQIWDTMMMASTSQLSTAGRGGSGVGERRGHGDKASHHFCDSRLMAATGHISGPNLETFSVLLQAYASRNDIDGVASVYQEIKKKQQQHPPRFSKPPLLSSISETGTAPSALTTTKKQLQSLSDVNTVLLNQILRLLVNVGENKAAREIFEEMERSVVTKEDGVVVKEGKSSHTVYSVQAKVESQELASLPRHRSHHHETFARRAFWRANKTQRSQEWKKQRESQQKDEQQSPSVASMALEPRRTTVSGKTGPDAHTVEIMLELARKEGDSAFEARLQTLLDKYQRPLP